MTCPSEEMLHGEYKTPGGKLVVADLCVRHGRLREVQIAGDFFLYPDEALERLRSAVEGTRLELTVAVRAAAIVAALRQSDELVGVDAEAVAVAVDRALGSRR